MKMKSLKLAARACALVVAVVAATSAANAAVVASLGGGTGSFVSLSSAGLGGGSIASLSGGTVYNSDQPFADIPNGGVFGGNFLAAGLVAGESATLTFTSPLSYLSFLVGSPDSFNDLFIRTTAGVQEFTPISLGFAVTDGNQAFSQYVQFQATPGDAILAATFTNNPASNAFEVANFSLTSGVPEPSTWAMMVLGFAGIGTMAYRRRKTQFAA